MDVITVGTIGAVVLLNVAGWIYAYGRLSQKVEHLEEVLNNGLCEKVDGISRHLSKLEGIVEAARKQQ